MEVAFRHQSFCANCNYCRSELDFLRVSLGVDFCSKVPNETADFGDFRFREHLDLRMVFNSLYDAFKNLCCNSSILDSVDVSEEASKLALFFHQVDLEALVGNVEACGHS